MRTEATANTNINPLASRAPKKSLHDHSAERGDAHGDVSSNRVSTLLQEAADIDHLDTLTESSASETAHSFQQNGFLAFHSQDVEYLFLVEEHERTSTRFIVSCFVMGACGLFYSLDAKQKTLLYISLALTIILISCGLSGLGLVYFRRKAQQLIRQQDENNNVGVSQPRTAPPTRRDPRESTTVEPQFELSTESITTISPPSPRQHGPRPHLHVTSSSSVAGHEFFPKAGGDDDHTADNAEDTIAWCARLHEVLTVFISLTFQVSAGFLYNNAQTVCVYYKHHDENAKSHENCPFRLYPFWFFFVALFSIIGSSPRFVAVLLGNCTAIATLVLAIQFHNTSTESNILILLFCFAFGVFMTVLKYVYEKQQRFRFQMQCVLEERRRETEERSAALKEFLLSITPTHLHSRLKNPSNTIQVDVSDDAVCLVIHTRNVVRFVHNNIPTDSAYLLGSFRHHVENLATQHDFHQIRAMGDMVFTVANLFKQDHATTQQAIIACTRIATSIVPPPSTACQLEVCCGAATGSLVGMPLGSACIRYDIFGPALNDAQALALVCPPGKVVNVSSTVLATMQDQLVVSTELSESSSDHIMKSSIVTGVADAVSQPNEPKELDIGVARRQRPLEAGCAFDFNALDLVGLGAAETEEHPTNTVIKVEARLAQTVNLQTQDGCGCVAPLFIDADTAAAATLQRRRQHSRSFVICSATGFVSIVLIILMAFSEKDRVPEDRFYSGTATLAVAAVVLGLVGIDAAVRRTAQHPIRVWHQHATFAMYLLSLVGTSLLRPGLAGEATASLCYLFGVTALFLGAGVRTVVTFLAICFFGGLFLEYLVMPQFARLHIWYLLGVIYVNAALLSNQQHVQLFTSTVQVKEALEEERVHEKIRKAVQDAIIPPQFALHIHPSYINRQRIRAWTVDECVAIVIHVSGVSDTTVNSTSVSMSDALALRAAIDSRMTIIERAVQSCPRASLSIASAFGGDVVIAGPFDSGRKNPAIPAIADALHLMSTLLAEGLQFAAGIALEQAVHALVVTSFPRYELMGPCLNTARLLVSAAPVEMVVLTEKAAKLYEQECDAVGGVELLPSDASDKWRLRDVGVMRVRRIKSTTVVAA